MSDKKQFFIFCLIISIISIIVWLYTLSQVPQPFDNVTNFKITQLGEVTKYIGNDEIVELPYVYTLDENGDAKFGAKYLVKSLNAGTFNKGNNITRLAISIFVNTIQDGAFNNLDNLISLVFRSKNPPQISANEINKLTKLKSIYVYKDSLENYKNDAVFTLFEDIIKVI